jgi:hypothetical protein
LLSGQRDEDTSITRLSRLIEDPPDDRLLPVSELEGLTAEVPCMLERIDKLDSRMLIRGV